MDVVALAPRALSCPHPYDPANEGELLLEGWGIKNCSYSK